MSDSTPRVAILTAAGRGGVAVVALEGRGGEEVLARAFRGKRGLPAVGRIALGELSRGTELVDEVLAARVADDRFELGCHGGPGVARQVLGALVLAGAREASAHELAAAPADATRIEALERLALAPTELAGRALAFAAAGGLASRVVELARDARSGDLQKIKRDLDALEATARFGLACSEAPAVALVGRPNAGKSTLWNAFVGREQAIVSPEPGTTRDVLEETVSLDGLPVRLLDLAGLRASEDPVEREGVARGRDRAARASLRLVLVDASEPHAIGDLDPGPDALLVLTKRDLVGASELERAAALARSGFGRELECLAVSAPRASGLDELARAIERALVGSTDLEALARAPAIFTERQRALVRSARAALERGEREEAARRLEEVLSG